MASVGDLLLLYVGNTQRPELGLPQVGVAWLWVGAVLGVLAIPYYVLGYRAASHLVAPSSAAGARALFVGGAVAAAVGAVIHGVTALLIGAQLHPGQAPLGGLVDMRLLAVLWGVAGIGALVASVLFAWFVGRRETMLHPAIALANPALVTLGFALLGMPVVWLRAFLVPAAPNLAHLVFFAVCAWALGSATTSRRER